MAEVLALEPLFERFPAKEKRFAEVVVMVHHYGGHRLSFKPHIDWLNSLGFDVVSFNLPFRTFTELMKGLPINKSWRFGIRHMWADKIEAVLGALPEFKFIFSFSLPSSAVIAALAKRHAVDVRGLICEGGPFLQLPLAGNNLFRYHILKGKPSFLNTPRVREVLANLSGYAMGLHTLEGEVAKYLRALPKGFPVLSIRGGKDKLVSPVMIDEFFFQALNQIDYERAYFAEAEHLTALRDEPEAYKALVERFLIVRATPL